MSFIPDCGILSHIFGGKYFFAYLCTQIHFNIPKT